MTDPLQTAIILDMIIFYSTWGLMSLCFVTSIFHFIREIK